MTDARKIAVAFGLAGGILALGAFALPRIAAARLRRTAVDTDVLAPFDHTRSSVSTGDGGGLSVVRAGSGPPIVLSHGATLSVRAWTKQLHSLPAAGFEVVAYDQRGHGRSHPGDGGHAVDHLGLDLATVICELDLREAVLVGHSMGGIAVQSLLLDHPEVARERVRGIVLLSTLARVPLGSQATRLKDRLERITDRAPDSTPIWRSPDLGLLLARVGFGNDPDAAHVELVRQMMLECSPETRLESPRALIGADFVDRLHEISVPTLVVGGTRDVMTPLFHSRLLASHIPNAELEIFEGGGHMLMLEDAERLDALVVDFARRAHASVSR